ncbi:Hsp70 family protein [Dactylosporangium sp. CA-092794]|uniref:Hsp70 family protein n=1 Tax=Dactylosporangium sp. CA-092794 TaxID=3239929 RepID=UPI003D94033B
MPTPGIRLGVDFGTSNTVAVVRWPDGRSRPLIFDGSPLLPSAVYAEPGGAIIVGRDAVHSARLEPARFEPNPKRRIDEGAVLLGDREVPVNELFAAVLRRVRDEFARTVGEGAPEVTVTIPASWGATRRLSIADAAAAAGLGRVRLVPEPVAAAAYFTQVLGREVRVGSVVVVHDFGAGTFDASVVARTAGGFEVLAVDGRDDIGGIDVDNAIVKHIGTICEPQAPQEWHRLMQPQTVEDRRHRRLLWDDARVAKERLSRQPASDLTIPLLNIDVHLTREELERLAQPMLEQTVRVTQGVMRWAQLPQDAIAGVFLVGGSSRMPLVATLLHRMLGTAPVAIEQPELVVAEGSMLAGSTAMQPRSDPAPGPSTGVLPQVPGLAWQPGPAAPPPASAHSSAPPLASAHSSAPPPASTQSSAPPAAASPASAPPASAAPDGLLWPDAGALGADAPVSGTPFSGGYSAPPPGGFQSTPVSAPPGGSVSAPPGGPVSAPPVVPVSPPPLGPPAAPSFTQSSAPPSFTPPTAPPSFTPLAAPPSFTPPSAPPSFTPSAAPPSFTPAAATPPQRPVSAPPNRPVSSGRVFVSGGVPEPSTRYDEYGNPFHGDAAPSPAPPRGAPRPPSSRPTAPARPQPSAAKVYDGARRRRGPVARALLTLIVLVLLVATPLAAGCVSYYLTTDHWPEPVAGWLDSSNP